MCYVVFVEDAEDERSEFGRVALRKELLVDADETLQHFQLN